MLNNLNGKLDDTQKQLIEHIQNTEQQQATTTGLVNRLENVDQRLAAADERMDTLSAMLAALVDGNPGSVPGSRETGQAAPLPAQDKIPGLQPVQRPEVPASSAGKKPAPAAPETSALAAQQPAPAVPASSQAGSTGKPAATAANTAAEPKPEIPVPAAVQQAAADPAGSRIEAAVKPVEITPEPVPVTKPEPAAPVAAGIAAGSANGNWVINVASYTNEKIARRKLAQMQQQGVDVELVTARVNGKTLYRARVFGFASRRDAETHAAGIRAKLGIEETWITKR
jgi:cell division protein FtsN